MAKEIKVYSKLDTLPKGKTDETIIDGTLVLEGGSLRAVYTSGVIDCLMENNLNFRNTIGVSAGSLTGICYATGQIGRAGYVNLKYRHDPNYVGANALAKERNMFGFKYMFYGKPAKDWPLDLERLQNSDRKMIAVVTNVKTGKPEYKEFHDYDTDMFYKIMQASSSMPFFSPMVRMEKSYFLDGGCADKIPYQYAKDNFPGKIVVIRTQDKSYRKGKMDKKEKTLYKVRYGKYKTFYQDLIHMNENYDRQCDEIETLEKEGKIFVLYPSEKVTIGHVEGDMEKLGHYYWLGYEDMKRRLEELKKYLEK